MPDTMDYKAWQRVKKFMSENASPAGVISPFAGASENVPEGWLLCDGSEVSRTQYAKLFKTIGTLYGEGDGNTTFNLPDLRGRFVLGSNNSGYDLAKTGGEEAHALSVDELASHTHTQQSHSHTISADSAGSHTHTATTSSNGSHTHTGSGTTSSNGVHAHSTDRGTAVGSMNAFARASGTSSTGEYGMYSAGSHTHTYSFTTSSSGGHTHTLTTSSNGSHTHSGSSNSVTPTIDTAGKGLAHNNMPPYLALNYIIKC